MLKRLVFVLLVLCVTAPAAMAQNKIGGQFALLPVGEIKLEGGGDSATADTETAFAIGALAEFGLNPNFSLGLAPRVILNVKGEDANESAKQFDIAARLTGHGMVAPGTRLYGYAAPGYSFLSIPDWPDELDQPKGFILGFGGGVGFGVAPNIELIGEIGYQLGFQGISENGESADVKTNFLHLAFGALFAF